MLDQRSSASGRDGVATPGLVFSALTLLLLIRGSERLARWLVEIDECHGPRAGRRRRGAD